MKNCLFCLKISEDRISICDCGYNFEKGEITNGAKIKHWIDDPEHWPDKIERQKKVHDFQKEHYNSPRVPNDPYPQWSVRKLAKLLNKKNSSHLSLELRLAEAFLECPELKNCKNKTIAIRKFKEMEGKSLIKNEERVFEYEEGLHNYLEKNWGLSPFGNEWTLEGSKYKTEIGEIDLLAKNEEDNKWLVIELKKDQASDETVGQILRYMGFVKRSKLCSKDEVVIGLIIARTFDKQILYALDCCAEIRLKKYSFQNGRLKWEDIDDIGDEIFLIDFNKLTDDERKKFIDDLKKLKTELE